MRLILAIIILCAVARADTKITWLADVTADRAETVTGAQSGQVANAVAHIVRADNPHGVTAAQIGALTAEQDLAALRTYHYGSPDIVESPAEWFVFDGAGTITAFNWEAGRTNVVIPWAIGGVPVTSIGGNAFASSGVVSLIAPQTVTSIGAYAFNFCYVLASILLPQVQTVGEGAFTSCDSLASVSLPLAQTVGEGAFNSCSSLASVLLPLAQTVGAFAFESCGLLASVYFGNDAPTIGEGIFSGITPNQVTNYVTNPQATGWGATFGGMPVVRPPLYADAIYQAGELVATFSQIAASNALPYTAWTGTITPANGTATVSIAHGNQPVLVIDAPTVLQLDATGFGTSGVSRLSLSYYPGTNSFTFATNIINYAETPSVDTNGWNTLLIRRVSDGAWKGVGL